MVFPIVQSYKFKSKSQQGVGLGGKISGVSDSSKLQIQKQITTTGGISSALDKVFPIVQSYKFKSKSQLLLFPRGEYLVFPIVQSYKFKSKSQRHKRMYV